MWDRLFPTTVVGSITRPWFFRERVDVYDKLRSEVLAAEMLRAEVSAGSTGLRTRQQRTSSVSAGPRSLWPAGAQDQRRRGDSERAHQQP